MTVACEKLGNPHIGKLTYVQFARALTRLVEDDPEYCKYVMKISRSRGPIRSNYFTSLMYINPLDEDPILVYWNYCKKYDEDFASQLILHNTLICYLHPKDLQIERNTLSEKLYTSSLLLHPFDSIAYLRSVERWYLFTIDNALDDYSSSYVLGSNTLGVVKKKSNTKKNKFVQIGSLKVPKKSKPKFPKKLKTPKIPKKVCFPKSSPKGSFWRSKKPFK